MYLKRGITIHSSLPGISEQVQINNGTMKPGKATGLYYHPGSAVPRVKWRSPNPAEQRLLMTNGPFTDYRKNIYIGEVPPALRESLAALGLHKCTELDQVIPRVKRKEKEVKLVSRKLDKFLRPFSSTGNYKFHRITRAMPGRETTTCFYINDRFVYVGLHIDQSRKFTPYTALKSGNRISINLGSETRYLEYINLTMIQAVQMIKERSGLTYNDINSDNISTLFFKYCSDYPAIKISLEPYQFYIAPTDNFFHDATTRFNTKLDVTIVYTGLFDSTPTKK
ncbi:MAG: hypothetical protein JNM68_15310 [Dinghuibacter sp.]|nr:hypothetical protein [Dinghuibacter sp.]